MVEELEVADGQISAIGHTSQAVSLPWVSEHDRSLAVEAEGVVEAKSILESYGRIIGAVHDQKRLLSVGSVGNRRLE